MSRKTTLFALACTLFAVAPTDQVAAEEPAAAATMHALVITGSTNVTFTGYIDGSGDLQFRYGTLELSDYNDSVVIESDVDVTVNLREPVGEDLTASHQENGQTVTWTSQTWGVVHRFSSGTQGSVAVDAEVPPEPPKTVFVDFKPTGGL